MVHHVALFSLKPEVTPAKVEEMMRQTRISLLKIDEVCAVKCGRNVEAQNQWGFFMAIDVESMDKLAVVEQSAIFLKYTEEVIKPNTLSQVNLNYEMDPVRPEIRYI